MRILPLSLLLVFFLPTGLYGQKEESDLAYLQQFLSDYVRISSISGHEYAAGNFFAQECHQTGLHVRIFSQDSFSYNFAASLYPLDLQKPNIILLNHIDVVSEGDGNKWSYPPFSGQIAEGSVWGRGAIDNKGMAAMQLGGILPFVQLAKAQDLPFNVTILAVSGEETGGKYGAKLVTDHFFSELNPVVVLGEGGTGMRGVLSSDPEKVLFGVSIAHKRMLWLKLKLNLESSGHGSVPPKEYANKLMVEALGKLNKKKRRLKLSESTRIMFSQLGHYENGFKGFALKNINIFKPFISSALRKEPVIEALVSNTVTLTQIRNPEGPVNQIPQEMEVILDCRLLPETDTDDFIRELKRQLRMDQVEIEIIHETVRTLDTQPDAFYYMLEAAIKKENPHAEVAPILFPATNDNNFFRARGISTYGILPVLLNERLIQNIHNTDEHLPLELLESGIRVYEFFLDRVFASALSPKTLAQTVKGTIFDQATKLPLSDFLVIVANDTAVLGAVNSNILGKFRMDEIPLGKYYVKIFGPGYEELKIQNVQVTSGRETIINIGMAETTFGGMITPKVQEVTNDLATVSIEGFAIEETERFPGTRDDPARMVSRFAGVRAADDSRNDILVRGNAPWGLGWRLMGVDIPNPNHYALLGTTGGGLNLVSSKILANSDFLTGAFPAEYGNALAGVFDLQLRSGNDEKLESSVHFGSVLSEITIEGPLNRASGASFLTSFRHSTLSILDILSPKSGLDYAKKFGVSAIPKFKDLAFKLNFPGKAGGYFSLFGLGANSNIGFLDSQRDSCSFSFEDHNQNVDFGSDFGLLGLIFQQNFKSAMSLKITAYFNQNSMFSDRVRLFRDSLTNEITGWKQEYWNRSAEMRSGIWVVPVKKINAQHTIKAGFNAEYLHSKMLDTLAGVQKSNTQNGSELLKGFLHWKYQFSNNLTLNLGLFAMFHTPGKQKTLEPRGGLIWKFSTKESLNLGIGFHSQLLPNYLFYQNQINDDGTTSLFNQDVGLIRSQHYILGYNLQLSENIRMKLEGYFQYLQKVPVEIYPSSFSLINRGLDFKLSFPEKLLNTGTGQNYGLDFTLERIYSQKFYYLLTMSLSDSRYSGSDNVWRNTDFNGHYSFNLLAGKDFNIGYNVFSLGGAFTFAGGRRYTPIDPEASRARDKTVYLDSLAFSQQFKPYFRADLKFKYRINSKKMTHELGLDLLNVIPVSFKGFVDDRPESCRGFQFSTPNILRETYDPNTGKVRNEYQLGFLPMFFYEMTF